MDTSINHNKPLVSVIIPCYNSGKWIGECLNSVCEQTYENIEIIVVDDGSSDKTDEIIKAIDNPLIHYFYKKNEGSSASRNYGIKKANGTLIAFLDSDDVWHKTKVEEQVNIIKKGFDFVYCDFEILGSKSSQQNELSFVNPENYKQPIKTVLLKKNIVSGGSCVLLKKHIFDKVGLFNESIIIGEDWELWTRIFWHDYKPYFINKKLSFIRKNDHSVQHTTNTITWKKSIEAVFNSFFSLPNLSSKEKAIIYNGLFVNSYKFNGPPREMIRYRAKGIYHNPTQLFNLASNVMFSKYFIKKLLKSM